MLLNTPAFNKATLCGVLYRTLLLSGTPFKIMPGLPHHCQRLCPVCFICFIQFTKTDFFILITIHVHVFMFWPCYCFRYFMPRLFFSMKGLCIFWKKQHLKMALLFSLSKFDFIQHDGNEVNSW